MAADWSQMASPPHPPGGSAGVNAEGGSPTACRGHHKQVRTTLWPIQTLGSEYLGATHSIHVRKQDFFEVSWTETGGETRSKTQWEITI